MTDDAGIQYMTALIHDTLYEKERSNRAGRNSLEVKEGTIGH